MRILPWILAGLLLIALAPSALAHNHYERECRDEVQEACYIDCDDEGDPETCRWPCELYVSGFCVIDPLPCSTCRVRVGLP